MGCSKTKSPTTKTSTRDSIAVLFERGNIKGAFAHRLTQCAHASECGRLCKRLVKGLGVSQIHCVNEEAVNLYEALENPDFICPEGLF